MELTRASLKLAITLISVMLKIFVRLHILISPILYTVVLYNSLPDAFLNFTSYLTKHAPGSNLCQSTSIHCVFSRLVAFKSKVWFNFTVKRKDVMKI